MNALASLPRFCGPEVHEYLRQHPEDLLRLRPWPELEIWIGECVGCHSTLAVDPEQTKICALLTCARPFGRNAGWSAPMWGKRRFCSPACYHLEAARKGHEARRKRLIGVRFGRLIVSDVTLDKRASVTCDCGVSKSVLIDHVERGKIRSCGCLMVEVRDARLAAQRTHGLTNSPEMQAWQHARQRCYDPRIHNYDRYGGRGIRMCDRWLESFSNFLADMGRRPSPQHSIDRIDNDGNYEPGNCRWATAEEQASNKSNNRILTFKGQSLTLSEWSRRTGLSVSCLHRRLESWTVERALTEGVPSAADEALT